MPDWGVPDFKEYLEEWEVRAIIEACQREADKLVLETLWQSAARVSEVLSLTPEWIGQNSLILPNLKQRNKEAFKECVVSEELCTELRDFAKANSIPDGTRIFRSPATPEKPMNRMYVWRTVTRIAGELGIVRMKMEKGKFKGEGKPHFTNAWVHLFRHASGMKILEDTKKTEVVQYQLGHSSIVTTQAYARIKNVRAKEELGRINWRKSDEEHSEDKAIGEGRGMDNQGGNTER